MPDPRAVIVDVGGVLTTPLRDSFSAFCNAEGIELTALEAAIGDLLGVADDEHPVAQLESGLMELGAFEAWLASDLNRCLGTNIAGDGIARRLLGGVSLEERMLNAIARIRAAGLRAGLLSNSWGSTDYGPLGELFDAVVISGDEGMRKPDPRIYRLAAERLDVDSATCVFVDDVAVNCEGAKSAGMLAIHHTDPDTTIAQLEGLLGVRLRTTEL